MLTPAQQAELRDVGFVRIERAFEEDVAAEMEDKVWKVLANKYRVSRDKRSTWRVKGVLSSLQELKSDPLFARIGSERTLSAIDSIIGQGRWKKPKN